MRFMVLVKATEDSEAGKLPDEKLIVAMGKFNEELIKGGVLIAGDGLHASSKGARIKLSATGPAISSACGGSTAAFASSAGFSAGSTTW